MGAGYLIIYYLSLSTLKTSKSKIWKKEKLSWNYGAAICVFDARCMWVNIGESTKACILHFLEVLEIFVVWLTGCRTNEEGCVVCAVQFLSSLSSIAFGVHCAAEPLMQVPDLSQVGGPRGHDPNLFWPSTLSMTLTLPCALYHALGGYLNTLLPTVLSIIHR